MQIGKHLHVILVAISKEVDVIVAQVNNLLLYPGCSPDQYGLKPYCTPAG